MSMEQNLNELIEELIQEVEQELDEATTTASVDGYNTPFAFGTGRKKDKKKEKETATQAGYTIAEGEDEINEAIKKITSSQFKKLQDAIRKVNPRIKIKLDSSIPGGFEIKIPDDNKWEIHTDKVNSLVHKITGDHRNGRIIFEGNVNEAKVKRPVNRWLELKNDETMHPHKKMAMGLKELKYQLREVEKFFSWYNKIKTMNELDSQNYWKRTNNHIYKIKERLINIAKTIKEIEK